MEYFNWINTGKSRIYFSLLFLSIYRSFNGYEIPGYFITGPSYFLEFTAVLTGNIPRVILLSSTGMIRIYAPVLIYIYCHK